ncbi:MAG: NYN domain-containing protein [Armatimonadetes bacterium]|nr:NYN domain-containing protein [Armatimonadota bacterium]
MYPESHHAESLQWESDVALFLDWENLKISLHKRGLTPDLSLLRQASARYGRLVTAKAYADWNDPHILQSQDQAHLFDHGFDPVYVPSHLDADPPQRRVHLIETKLNTDCMELSFTTPQIGTYLLVSGRLRFPFLTQSLRRRGYRVIHIGFSWNAPNRTRERVDDILYYDQLSQDPLDPPYMSPHSSPTDDLNGAIEELIRLVRDRHQKGRPAMLSWLGHQLRKQIPGFHPQSYGFEKFKDLVAYAERLGLLMIVTRGLLDWAVLPEEEGIPRIENLPPSNEPGEQDNAKPYFLQPDGDPGAQAVQEFPCPLDECPELFEDLVRAADQLESDSRYGFVTPGLLGQYLWRQAHVGPADVSGDSPAALEALDHLQHFRGSHIRKLVNASVDLGLLRSATLYDPGTRKAFTTVRLCRTHPFVLATLHPLSYAEPNPGLQPPLPSSSEGADQDWELPHEKAG